MARKNAAAPVALSADGATAQGPRPGMTAQDGYREAFDALMLHLQAALKGTQAKLLPIRIYIAGGAALNLLTGARVTEDVDATFSKRVLLSDDIAASYRDSDGRARMVYLDRNYNDTLGLLHEDAYADSLPVEVPGIDKRLVEVRVLKPLDLAVTKLARFSDQDREDIRLLAREGLIDAGALRRRAEAALGGYVGDLDSVRTSIDVACRLIEVPPRAPARSRKARRR
jgi:Nucleotidyltransferase of unknown function (DUF6036)